MEKKNEIRVVLIGKTGSGKSATGNTLLGTPNAFEENDLPSSVTGETTRRETYLPDLKKTLAVIDTPGLFDTHTPENKVTEEIVKCIGLSCPGPHAFLYILKVGERLTDEEHKTLDKYVCLFGEHFYKFLIIVFTHKNKLGNTTIQEYAHKCPSFVTDLLKLCNDRIIGIENEKDTDDRRNTVKQLLNMIEAMKARADLCYDHKMFRCAEKALQNRLAELGGDAFRSVVYKEVESGGQALNYLYAAGVGAFVGVVSTIGICAAAPIIITGAAALSAAAATPLAPLGVAVVATTAGVATLRITERTWCVIM